MPITVRRIQADDVDLLRRVRLAALADTPSAFAKSYDEESGYPDEFWAERARSNASGAAHTTFFAFDGEACVGLVGGHAAVDGDHVDLVSMWTDPAARGTGVGAALVVAVLDWADGRAVELWVTRGNDAALRLYERCGFAETGDHQPLPSDPCKDEIRMRHIGG
ncbi:MAG: GNAT family N-acetyltransferase [Acidimicrobiales bacterium]|nr:GNAT family N-acetyltransferase [Acidimicrobiales bacterium]